MKRLMILMLCAGLVLPFGGGQDLSARKRKKKEQTEQSDTVKKETDYDKLMKEKPQTWKGFITVHKSKEKLYFEVPKTILGRDMLLGSIVSEISDNYAATAGTQPFEPLHIKFEQLGQKVNIVKVTKDYITDSDNPAMKENIDRNSAGSVIKSFKVHSYNADSSAVVFEVTDFFVGDEKSMRPFSPYGLYEMAGLKCTPIFQSDKSFLGECKAFDRNVNIKSYLSYTMSLNMRDGRSYVEDEPFTAQMTRSLILLDSIPYAPRRVDSRMAMFPTGKIRFNVEKQGSETVYFVNRWRMEPSDTAAYRSGKTVDPVKPIVFYIDPAFPAEWKDAIFQAVEMWQEPFEKIGFSNAILAKEYPTDDPAFDPDNILYSCIRYNPLGFQNAMGPSWVDPRSGEIINASVYVYHDVVKLVNNWRYIQTAQTDESVRSGKLPKDVLDDAIRYVIGHEVGHCLGLMHNMSASAVIPVDSLRSPSFTRKYGTTTSIMDYARFNYVAQPGDKERGVRLTPPKFGVYDYFSIGWAYTPVFDVDGVDEEYEITSKWLTDAAADPVYRYGKQQFGGTIDPRSQSEDLGDDAMKASAYGISNLKYILANLNDWVEDDPDYQYRKDIYIGIIYQYITYIQHVFANVGGIYLNEKMDGDPVTAYECVPKEKQKEAFEFICDQLSDLDWLDNQELLRNQQLMGSPKEAVELALVGAVIASPFKVAQPAKMGDNAYTPEECMKDVYDFVWGPTAKGRKLNEVQKMLQREYLAVACSGAGLLYEGAGASPVSLASGHAGVAADMAAGMSGSFGVPHSPVRSSCHDAAGKFGVRMPEFLADYARMNRNVCFHEVMGYNPPHYMFVSQPVLNQDCYAYILKVQSLLKSRVGAAAGDTKAHYELLLRNIEKTLE